MATLNTMREEVLSLPALIRAQVPVIDERVRAAFNPADLKSLRQVILTGCGDSYYAGLGSRFFFNKLCGLPAQGINAMDTGRYILFDIHPGLAKNTLVMATSVSGRVSRTVEAMRISREKGGLCTAITGNPDGPLAQNAARMIDCTIPSLPNPENEPVPGVRSYRMTLIVHFLTAIAIAEANGSISRADGDALRARITQTADAIEETLSTGEAEMKDLASALAAEDYFLFVGHGPHRAAAEFSAAKVIEAAGLTAYGQDTEEWAHIQHYENARPSTPTFLFCSGHRGHGLVRHMAPYVKGTGRQAIGIFAENCASDHTGLDRVFIIKGDTPELLTPMVYPVLPELFAAYLAEALGVRFFRKDDPAYKDEDLNRIRGDTIAATEDLQKASGG